MRPERVPLYLCIALVGCVSYDLVGLPTDEPTRAAVLVHSQQTDSVEVRVVAHFQQGTDSIGRLVTLRDTAIIVDGRPVVREAPKAITAVNWFFSWESGRIAPTTVADIVVDIPPLEHSPGTGITLVIPRTARIGPYAVTVPDTGDLRLPISAPEICPAPESTFVSWNTSIADACIGGTRRYNVATGSGWLPDDVRVPRPVIDAMGSDDFVVCFFAGTAYLLDGAPYPVQVNTASHIEWRARR
jgi:hypothetical protein